MKTSRRSRRRGPRSLHAIEKRSLQISANCRIRRQGPRSSEATLRRSRRHHVHMHESFEQGGRLCKPSLSPSCSDSSFSLIHMNIRGFISHRQELEVYLALLNFPALVGITETFLDQSVANPSLHGYSLVSRLDRRDGRSHGGIALFARDNLASFVVHNGDSETDERSWYSLHGDLGPMLIGLWYRPPSHYKTGSITRFSEELHLWNTMSIGTIVLGDMNVHHAPWLRYSSRASPAGHALLSAANRFGLVEHVGKPTRGKYLLDLVLSDLGSIIRAEVRVGIADHCLVLVNVAVPVPSSVAIERWCFHYKRANWPALFEDLESTDWIGTLSTMLPDNAAMCITSSIMASARRHIPYALLNVQKTSHPWINGRCRELLRTKHAAIGSESFKEKQQACSAGLLKEYSNYVARTKARLHREPSGSRRWWKLAQKLCMKGPQSTSTPPLKCPNGSWVTSAVDKANLLADTFQSKSCLPGAVPNEFSLVPVDSSEMYGFLPVRVRTVRAVLKQLRPDSGTGPDGLPARLLKACGAYLARPLTILARMILATGCWPDC